jgi:hypothetical protein
MITLLKKEIDEMMKLKGNVKGVILKGHFDYIRDLKGEEGVKLVENRLEELGYPLEINKIDVIKWYPEAHSCLVIMVAAETFNWSKEDVFKMAYEAPKYSFIVKLLMQHFVKIEKTFHMVPRYWRQNFDFSEMETVGFNEKEKYGIIRIKNYHKYHPLICVYHQGYFQKIAEIMLGQSKVNVEHTKCLFEGNLYEEYKITWK